ncbi:uncharacterized protein L969DRAFT_97276 [Mixia osmundae IAM 14324]|uniref:Uncharacterized protein n=1 Tax=Mixia osmundae (strain CBS 9802 / IAM 14324 / JCM 22182 / KY 12970) TaxID=764103 RepID=G7DW71_MIXOS|nr:uncharacterized protein L969DRAFT_97276 [Mixia osmundae IAM 14324]KEI36537.1 hypothetical protein L969DRAFT_97276 [Mixia osmundae IAM 14324]GAA94759.1 hypothetical protein E5Q_01413 [Mixia osmundae IAM 14324]
MSTFDIWGSADPFNASMPVNSTASNSTLPGSNATSIIDPDQPAASLNDTTTPDGDPSLGGLLGLGNDSVLNQYSAADFFIGLAITLGASVLNAAGLNLTKLDHVRNDMLPRDKRRPDWQRPLWWCGLIAYILSQLVGSTLALAYLRAEYVAPLGSASLIFNFIFASILVGTKITKLDIIGTVTIVVGVVGVVAFGNIRKTSEDPEANLDLDSLKALWARPSWLVYLVCLEAITIVLFWAAGITDDVLHEREEIGDKHELETDGDDRAIAAMQAAARARASVPDTSLVATLHQRQTHLRSTLTRKGIRWSQSRSDVIVKKLAGSMWAVSGGLLAGQSLVFAKSTVKLVTNAMNSTNGSQFSFLTIIIAVLLLVTAVVQVYCLNKGLKAYDSTLVVPIFFAVYTASGFINSLIYLNETGVYKVWVFTCIWLSMLVLVIGVGILSSKKPETTLKPTVEDDEEEMLRTDGIPKDAIPLTRKAFTSVKSTMSYLGETARNTTANVRDRQLLPGKSNGYIQTPEPEETVWDSRDLSDSDDEHSGGDKAWQPSKNALRRTYDDVKPGEEEFGSFVHQDQLLNESAERDSLDGLDGEDEPRRPS